MLRVFSLIIEKYDNEIPIRSVYVNNFSLKRFYDLLSTDALKQKGCEVKDEYLPTQPPANNLKYLAIKLNSIKKCKSSTRVPRSHMLCFTPRGVFSLTTSCQAPYLSLCPLCLAVRRIFSRSFFNIQPHTPITSSYLFNYLFIP